MDRRSFLAIPAGLVLGSRTVSAAKPQSRASKPIKALLFDALTLFDVRPLGSLAQRLYADKASSLMQAWRSRQFEYQWLRLLGGRYVDFLETTNQALSFAGRQVGVEIDNEARRLLMGAYTDPQAWPDTQSVLPRIRQLGVSLGILSNMTSGALESGLHRAGLSGLFGEVLSTDRIRSYKPAREAYQLGVDTLGLHPQEVLFVAFAGWDVAGAVWFGYPTFWLNRPGSVSEELGASPLGAGSDLNALLDFLKARAVTA